MDTFRDRDDACCDEWEENIPVIDNYLRLRNPLTPVSEYQGPPFRYCPYCGAPRVEERVTVG